MIPDKEGIIVSPTEPVVNRRKVWMQKGKNKFNVNLIPSNAVISNNLKGTLTFSNNSSNVGYADTGIKLSSVIQGIVGQTYTLNFDTTSNAPRKNSFYLLGANIFITKETPFVLTQEMLDSTIILYGGYNETSTITNIQLEQNTIATPYEAYIEEKVWILNKNGVYEEFSKKEEDTGWIDLDLKSGFVTYDWDRFQYRKKNSVVYLRGVVNSDKVLKWGDIIATLPLNCRTEKEIDITCRTVDDNAIAVLEIEAGSGNIIFLYKANSSNNRYSFLINISFLVD